MTTPAETAGAIVEEVPTKTLKSVDPNAEAKQQIVPEELVYQNELTDDIPKTDTSVAMKTAFKRKARKYRREKSRERINSGETLASNSLTWKIVKLLCSGGFGDVYEVVKENDMDQKEYAMKTEVIEGDKIKLRLKIEGIVLSLCHAITNPEKKKHFLPLIDRGKTEKFKFLVMGLVGKSLEDIRRTVLLRNFSKSTAMNASLQTLQSIWDLHDVGYLHRDIKPQNFAVGLGEFENTIYMIDFGIARKYRKRNTQELKVARLAVKFLGTVRFASRACHLKVEQNRKDDLETWLYMLFDLFDSDSLPWKKTASNRQLIAMKEKFMKLQYPKSFKIVPNEIGRIAEYINGMAYAEEPDYLFIQNSLKAIAKENKIDVDKQPDWIGISAMECKDEAKSPTISSENMNSGSYSSYEDEKTTHKKQQKSTTSKNTSDSEITTAKSVEKH